MKMHFFNLTLLIMIDKYVHIIIEKYHMCSEICEIRLIYKIHIIIKKPEQNFSKKYFFKAK